MLPFRAWDTLESTYRASACSESLQAAQMPDSLSRCSLVLETIKLHRDFDPKSPQYRRFTQVITEQNIIAVQMLCVHLGANRDVVACLASVVPHAGRQPAHCHLTWSYAFLTVFAVALQTYDGSWACCVVLQQTRGPQRLPRLSMCSSCLH